MKYYIKVWYSLCLLIGLLASCNEDGNLVPTGTLYLNVEEDQTLQTRATSEVTYESLQVAILQGEEDTLKVYNDYLTEVKGQRLVLPVGKYTVAVRSNGADGVAWETPLYQGSEEVEVKQGEITNTKVTCTIANTKVSVVYADDLNEYFTDYQTTVSTPSGALLYTRDEYRAGFFTPEKLTVLLKLVNNDGNEFVIKKVYPDIEPQYHYTFKFTVSNDNTDDEAGADVDVDVDKEHQEITYNIFVKEEPQTGIGEPSVELGGSFTKDVYTFKRTEQNPNPALNTIWLDYMLGKKNTLQSFVVTMDSPMGVSCFDITKGEGNEIGFPAVPGSSVETDDPRYTAYRMDLSTIVQHLECLNEQPTEYTFKVDILDDKYQETSITFVIKMMPNVSAYVDDPVCWTSFAVLKGVCEGENLYFKLQKKGDDNSVQEIRTVYNDHNGNIMALVTDLQVGVEYSYWLVSDDDPTMPCKPVDFITHTPLGVPNLSLDDWGERQGGGAIAGTVTYKCAQGNNVDGGVYWESGNRGAVSGSKVLLQSEDKDVIKGKAAKLTSQWAGFGTAGAFSAGSIFSGYVKSVSIKGAELVYGQLFNGYPTALTGSYKYSPGLINWKDGKEVGSPSETDEAVIYIALTTSQCFLKSLTSEVVPFNPEGDNVIAYGELRTQQENADYKDFKIDLKYKSSRMPEYDSKVYLIIMATSSSKGDFFTGSTNSWMLLDELGLIYDYNEASFVGTEFEELEPQKYK